MLVISPRYSLLSTLLSSNIALNTSCELLCFLLRYLWPLLTFGPSADHQNSVLQNPRTSICKGEAHKLKPTSSNLLPSCLVPRLAYALLLSSTFIRVHQRNWFWQMHRQVGRWPTPSKGTQTLSIQLHSHQMEDIWCQVQGWGDPRTKNPRTTHTITLRGGEG